MKKQSYARQLARVYMKNNASWTVGDIVDTAKQSTTPYDTMHNRIGVFMAELVKKGKLITMPSTRRNSDGRRVKVYAHKNSNMAIKPPIIDFETRSPVEMTKPQTSVKPQPQDTLSDADLGSAIFEYIAALKCKHTRLKTEMEALKEQSRAKSANANAALRAKDDKINALNDEIVLLKRNRRSVVRDITRREIFNPVSVKR